MGPHPSFSVQFVGIRNLTQLLYLFYARSTTPSRSPSVGKWHLKFLNSKHEILRPRCSIRAYSTSFHDRVSGSNNPKNNNANKYADRERGDLGEFAGALHGLSVLTAGRDLPVLKAWERRDFATVIDICDDVIEADGWEYERLRSKISTFRTSMTPEDQKRQSRGELYIFHRNVKAAALSFQRRYSDALKIADETIRLTDRKDRDSLCLRGTALNFLGSSEKNRSKDEESLKCFTEALALLSPGGHDFETSLNQATLYFKLGRHNEAIEAAQAALNYVEINDSHISVIGAQQGGLPSMQSLNNMLEDDIFAAKPGEDDEPIEKIDSEGKKSKGAVDPMRKAMLEQEKIDKEWVNPNPDGVDPRVFRQTGLDREHIRYDPELRLLLSAVNYSMARYEECLTQSQLGLKAIKRKGALGSPVLSKILEMQFRAYIAMQRYAEAELVSKMLMKIHPHDLDPVEHYVQLAMSQNRKFEEVWSLLQDYEKQMSHDRALYVRLLKIMLACINHYQKSEESIETCDKLLKLGAEEEIAYGLKSVAMLKLGRWKELLEMCESAEKAGYCTPELILAKAMGLEESRLFQDSFLELERAVTKFPEYAPAHLRYANALAKQGKINEALMGYNKAQELAYKTVEEFRMKSASHTPIQALARIATPLVQILMTKAMFLRTLGRLKEALEAYRGAAQFNPELARQIPILEQEFKAGNPTEFMSEDYLKRMEHIRQNLGKQGAGLDPMNSTGPPFKL